MKPEKVGAGALIPSERELGVSQALDKAAPENRHGEATVLGEAAAIATVTLAQPSRFWCAQGRALNAYLAANPDARHVLEHGFNVSLREKLEAMNRAAS